MKPTKGLDHMRALGDSRQNFVSARRLLARVSRDRRRGAAAPEAVAWHPRKQWLAAADPADAVRIVDYAPPGAAVQHARPFAPDTLAVLQHKQQRQVCAASSIAELH